jgi:hypothetical protein
MSARRSSHRSDRPRYPDIQAEIGEDPARYLHHVDETTFARIRGIADSAVLDAWYSVEEDIGPRRRVIAALNARRAALDDGDGG